MLLPKLNEIYSVIRVAQSMDGNEVVFVVVYPIQQLPLFDTNQSRTIKLSAKSKEKTKFFALISLNLINLEVMTKMFVCLNSHDNFIVSLSFSNF